MTQTTTDAERSCTHIDAAGAVGARCIRGVVQVGGELHGDRQRLPCHRHWQRRAGRCSRAVARATPGERVIVRCHRVADGVEGYGDCEARKLLGWKRDARVLRCAQVVDRRWGWLGVIGVIGVVGA